MENLEQKEQKPQKWKSYLKKIGIGGIIFFTVKGTITLLFGGYLLNLLCN